MNKQQLASKIWESANQMRSKIEANEYKDYILGFIFYKYLSDKLIQFARSEDFSDADIRALSEDDQETVDHIKSHIGYFIAYPHLFSTWIEEGADFDVSHVRDALSAFSRLIHPDHKALFEKIFATLETGLSKLGESAARQTKAISDLIQLIKEIPTDGRQGYDVLGFIYEYLIGMFAANAGKKAGEFYTPHEVSLLMSEIIAYHVKDKPTIQIYDSCSGSGSLLLNIGRSIAKYVQDKEIIKYYAQELKSPTYNLTRMNLIMRGILPTNIVTRNGDTLEDDWPFFDDQDPINSYSPLYLDAVVSNPPYSQKWDPAHKENDARFSRFGLAPKSKADFAFLLHDLYHLKPDGIMAIILPHGVLFRGGEEGTIRKNLIENDHLETIIGLPPNIFFGTGIPTTILILRQKRKASDVLIVDASKGFAREGKSYKLRASDIKRITDAVISRVTVKGFSRVVPKTEIRDNEYNLNISRYVDSSEPIESWDIYASMFGGIPMGELETFAEYWTAFPGMRNALFKEDGTPYVQPQVEDFSQSIRQHAEVQRFQKMFAAAFADFHMWLRRELIDQALTVSVPRQESRIGEEIIARLKPLPLIDPYHAYQCLVDQWQQIAVDLEILQTEGFDASRLVEPNLAEKTKDGKKVEVQEGWKGRILPFDLVQRTHHKSELDALSDKEARLREIAASLEETLERFSEEYKQTAISAELLSEEGDKFVPAAVAKEAKQLHAEAKKTGKFDPESYEAKIIQVADWLAEEKTLKAKVKAEAAALHLATKSTIEGLSDAQVKELLEFKWIVPISESLHSLPVTKLDALTAKVQALVEKYRVTYAANARAIRESAKNLAEMIGELDGNEFDLKGLAELKNLIEGKHDEKLATLKQAMLQKIFPQPGATTPELRFKGFEGDWENDAVSSILSERNIQAPKSEQYPLMAFISGQGVAPKGERYNRDFLVSDEAKKKYKQTELGDFIYSSNNLETGSIGTNNYGNASISPVYSIFSPTARGDSHFIGQLLSKKDFINKMVKWRQGVVYGQWRIHESDFLSIETTFPSLEEQRKIGAFFRQLDTLISLHATQLTKLKNLKAACLERMFVCLTHP